MKKHIQHTIKPKYSIGNNDLSDFIPLLFAVVLAYFLPIPFGFKAMIIYIGWEMTGIVSGLKKYFPRSFSSYVKYKFNLSKPKTLPTHETKEFAG
jgi:hypothetical protein